MWSLWSTGCHLMLCKLNVAIKSSLIPCRQDNKILEFGQEYLKMNIEKESFSLFSEDMNSLIWKSLFSLPVKWEYFYLPAVV